MRKINGNVRKWNDLNYHRDLRAEDRKLGRCQLCHKEPAKPSRRNPALPGSRCEACRSKSTDFMASYRKRVETARTKLGLCVRCGLNKSLRTTSSGASRDKRCAVCVESQDTYKANRRAKNVATA